LHISGKSYNTFNDFIFQGAYAVVFFDGTTTACEENIVSGGTIRGGHFRTYFYGRANNNTVRNATLRSRLIALTSNPIVPDSSHRTLVYAFDKFYLGETTERDCSVKVRDHDNSPFYKPTGNRVHNCTIFEGSQGANMGGDGGGDAFDFSFNTVSAHAAQAIYIQPQASGVGSPTNWQIHDNVMYNNGSYTAIRTNNIHYTMGTCYYYNNLSSQLDGWGTHIALYKGLEGGSSQNFASTIWFVHNTFHGGNQAIEWAGVDSGTGAPNYRFVNNVFTLETPANRVISGGQIEFDFEQVQARVGLWANNAHRGSFWFFAPPSFPGWNDGGNFYMSGPVWSTAQMQTDPTLPVGHAARNAGIDVSVPFTLRGTQWPALTQFPTGYYTGAAPDMGVVVVQASSPTFLRYGYYGPF
jgi:hypothetical protein